MARVMTRALGGLSSGYARDCYFLKERRPVTKASMMLLRESSIAQSASPGTADQFKLARSRQCAWHDRTEGCLEMGGHGRSLDYATQYLLPALVMRITLTLKIVRRVWLARDVKSYFCSVRARSARALIWRVKKSRVGVSVKASVCGSTLLATSPIMASGLFSTNASRKTRLCRR